MVRIEPKAKPFLVVGSIAFTISGVLLLVYPPHGDDVFTDVAATLTPFIQILSIAFGLVGTVRFIGLALQNAPVLAADASGISIDGGVTIAWPDVTSITAFEYKLQGTHRGVLIKLRDRRKLEIRQLGSFWTRFARRGTPGDVFIPSGIIKTPLVDAVAGINAERPR